jgi:hypothetical protein
MERKEKMITYDDALAALTELVEEDPDLVYEKWQDPDDDREETFCVYTTPNGTPSCGVGQVLAKLDMKLLGKVHLREWSSFSSARPYTFNVGTLAASYEGTFTEEAIDLLQEYQANQDKSLTRKDALTRALSGKSIWETT